MKKPGPYVLLLILTVISCAGEIHPTRRLQRRARIDPDYDGVVIPPNIAPLNFRLLEHGGPFQVRFSSENGSPIVVRDSRGRIEIPLPAWRRLLGDNRGHELAIEISVRSRDGEWAAYPAIHNRIAAEEIDGYLVYRLIKPLYSFWDEMEIWQRDLSSFDVSPLFRNRVTGHNCVNCHAFLNNSPGSMSLHMRGGPGTAMLLLTGGRVTRIDTRTAFNAAPAAYPAWHPDGGRIAFSVNKVRQFFHMKGENRDVFDKASDLILYEIAPNRVTTSPAISRPDRMETYPAWSADGRYLYFCSAPALESLGEGAEVYRRILYDLERIRFNSEDGSWGAPEPVLTAAETGLSIAHPRISPDNRLLLFCMSSYGNFTIYRPDSDLYLMDLEDGRVSRPEINSPLSDSYHSWSSNSRWVVFSSKRGDGLCARPYFCYVDENGTCHKPFLLPQRDPELYSRQLKTFNVPELITSAVKIRARRLARTASDRENELKAVLDPAVTARDEQQEERGAWRPLR